MASGLKTARLLCQRPEGSLWFADVGPEHSLDVLPEPVPGNLHVETSLESRGLEVQAGMPGLLASGGPNGQIQFQGGLLVKHPLQII